MLKGYTVSYMNDNSFQKIKEVYNKQSKMLIYTQTKTSRFDNLNNKTVLLKMLRPFREYSCCLNTLHKKEKGLQGEVNQSCTSSQAHDKADSSTDLSTPKHCAKPAQEGQGKDPRATRRGQHTRGPLPEGESGGPGV